MTYFKFPVKIKFTGVVIYYNHVRRSGTIRTESGAEFPFNASSVLCHRVECGDRVTFTEGFDMGHPCASGITKY